MSRFRESLLEIDVCEVRGKCPAHKVGIE